MSILGEKTASDPPVRQAVEGECTELEQPRSFAQSRQELKRYCQWSKVCGASTSNRTLDLTRTAVADVGAAIFLNIRLG
jgi:hypothetical protein